MGDEKEGGCAENVSTNCIERSKSKCWSAPLTILSTDFAYLKINEYLKKIKLSSSSSLSSLSLSSSDVIVLTITIIIHDHHHHDQDHRHHHHHRDDHHGRVGAKREMVTQCVSVLPLTQGPSVNKPRRWSLWWSLSLVWWYDNMIIMIIIWAPVWTDHWCHAYDDDNHNIIMISIIII